MEFKIVKKSYTKKKKLMLYIDREVLDVLDDMEPTSITVQEKIRQILKEYCSDDLGGL